MTKKGKATRNLAKLAADQGITPYDPNEKPDWEVPTDEEMNAYLKALRRMEPPTRRLSASAVTRRR